MTGFAEATRTAVAQAYDFSGIETLVDVGGGHGALLASVLAAHPSLRGVLFDLPTAIEGARGEVAARGLASRCELVAGDFFAAVPAGADAYILTGILHDWDDERSVAILRCRRRAIRASGRLLIGEQVLPEGGEPFFGKLLDLEMLVLVGGRERTEDEVPGPARPRRLRAGAGDPERRPDQRAGGVPGLMRAATAAAASPGWCRSARWASGWSSPVAARCRWR
jgi:hypothetical protein